MLNPAATCYPPPKIVAVSTSAPDHASDRIGASGVERATTRIEPGILATLQQRVPHSATMILRKVLEWLDHLFKAWEELDRSLNIGLVVTKYDCQESNEDDLHIMSHDSQRSSNYVQGQLKCIRKENGRQFNTT
jgi:hypothetical protein